jgi:hypothetical protein
MLSSVLDFKKILYQGFYLTIQQLVSTKGKSYLTFNQHIYFLFYFTLRCLLIRYIIPKVLEIAAVCKLQIFNHYHLPYPCLYNC